MCHHFLTQVMSLHMLCTLFDCWWFCRTADAIGDCDHVTLIQCTLQHLGNSYTFRIQYYIATKILASCNVISTTITPNEIMNVNQCHVVSTYNKNNTKFHWCQTGFQQKASRVFLKYVIYFVNSLKNIWIFMHFPLDLWILDPFPFVTCILHFFHIKGESHV